MRILIINHRFFHTGGPEQYMFAVTRLLRRKGHEVAHFSFAHPENIESEFSANFPTAPYGASAVYYDDARNGWFSKLSAFGKMLYNLPVAAGLKKIIVSFRPDLAYVIQPGYYMFPTALPVLAGAGLPVVTRVSDFRYICGTQLLFRNGQICEECRNGLWHMVINACIRDSTAVSATRCLAMYAERWRGIYGMVSRWVIPSRFTLDKMVEFGFDRNKMAHIPTFTDMPLVSEEQDVVAAAKNGGYFLYIGNVQPYKGTEFLLSAFARFDMGLPLKVVGIGQKSYLNALGGYLVERPRSEIEMLPKMPHKDVLDLIRNSAAVIIPSLCYENLPNVMIETMMSGKVAIASECGSLAEYLRDGETGLLFRPGDAELLREKLRWALDNPDRMAEIGKAARAEAALRFSPDGHYDELMKTFLVAENSRTSIHPAQPPPSAHNFKPV